MCALVLYWGRLRLTLLSPCPVYSLTGHVDDVLDALSAQTFGAGLVDGISQLLGFLDARQDDELLGAATLCQQNRADEGVDQTADTLARGRGATAFDVGFGVEHIAAIAAQARAATWGFLVQNHGAAAQAAAIGTARVVGAAGGAAASDIGVLNDGAVKVQHLNAILHVAVDGPRRKRVAGDMRAGVVPLDAVLQHLHVRRLLHGP